jgi:hypothetical protein
MIGAAAAAEGAAGVTLVRSSGPGEGMRGGKPAVDAADRERGVRVEDVEDVDVGGTVSGEDTRDF